MSFSSRRRNYLLTPHRRDGLIESMKSMLMHSFVLDALETTGADVSVLDCVSLFRTAGTPILH